MASKTALPIARLRSLGCKVSTVLGHNPGPNARQAEWRYAVRLPRGVEVDSFARSGRGYAVASRHPFQQNTLLVEGLAPQLDSDAAREQVEGQVAGLLNAVADVLSKAGR